MKENLLYFRKHMSLTLRYDIHNVIPSLKIIFICLTIFFSFIYTVTLWAEDTIILQHLLSWITLYVCGIPLVVILFKEVFSTPKNYSYLTIPASNSEKILSKIIVSTLFIILTTVLFNVVFSLIAVMICEPILKLSFGIFTPFTKNYFGGPCSVLNKNFLVLLISSYYKKYTRGKVIFYIGIALILLLLIWYSNEMCKMPFGQNHPLSLHFTSIGNFTKTHPAFTNLFKYYQWVVFAPLFWTLYYQEFKKLEV